MIEIKSKIHDKFSIEFKVGFVATSKIKDNNFAINTWLFVPNSLDINTRTYGKDLFYRDVKSNIRMITPVFLLRDIAGGEALPLNFLRKAMDDLIAEPSKKNIADYEYHIKMYSAITKSSLRNECDHILNSNVREDIIYLADSYAKNASDIINSYRQLRQIINVPTIPAEIRNYFSFGDEFISRVLEHYSFRIIKKLDNMPSPEQYKEARAKITAIIENEGKYKKAVGYNTIAPEDNTANRHIVYRHSILKKYVESDLYITLDKKQDGFAVQQVYYSIAAGIAMIFATVVAFWSQMKYGSYTLPVFVALVASYMLKDRIKDLMRYYFAHKLGSKYFDNKAKINIKNQEVGWIKEGVDFITESKTPKEVMEIRNRSSLLEAENRIFDEKIILYRKLVYINSNELKANNEYRFSGINDILRIYIGRFTSKMDDPQVPLRKLNDDGTVSIIYTDKIYYLNIVMQFQFESQMEYKRFRVVMTRNGITDVQEML